MPVFDVIQMLSLIHRSTWPQIFLLVVLPFFVAFKIAISLIGTIFTVF